MKWSNEHINRIAQKVIDNGGEYRTLTYCYYVSQPVTGGTPHLLRIENSTDGLSQVEDMGCTTILDERED